MSCPEICWSTSTILTSSTPTVPLPELFSLSKPDRLPMPHSPVKDVESSTAFICWVCNRFTELRSCHLFRSSVANGGFDKERWEITWVVWAVSSWMEVRRRWISIFSRTTSSCAWQSSKYLTVASWRATWTYGWWWMSSLGCRRRSNSARKL